MKTVTYFISLFCGLTTASLAQNSSDITSPKHAYENVRSLNELNTENMADAYPCLSSNGLQLYFVRGSNAADTIFFTSRTNLDNPFNKPTALNLNIPQLVSCTGIWLSPDELDFYVCSPQKFYHAHRTNRIEAFSSNVEEIKLEADEHHVIGGISLDAAQNQLFLNASSISEVVAYKRETATSSAFVYDYKVATNIRSSHLSKDGLSLFCSKNDDKNNTYFIELTRNSLNDKFDATNAQKLTGLSANNRNSQLSTSDNFDCAVFASSKENLWTKNDLYIARLVKTAAPEAPQALATTAATANVQLGANSVVVYPNPSSGVFRFLNTEKMATEAASTVELSIYNTLGETIIYNPRFVLADDAAINMYNQAKGVYFCRIMDAKKQVSVHRIVLE